MKRMIRGAVGVLALSFVLTGCSSRVANYLIEEEFYSEKPFVPAGANTVLPPKLDRVDLFSHIARGNYCVHYRILTGVDFSDVPPTPPQASNWTVSGLLAKITGGAPNPSQTDIDAAKGRATALEAQSTAEARAKRCKEEVERLASTGTDGNFSVSQRLARAYDEFARAPGKTGEFLTGDEQRQRRSQIQDEVLRASEQRCNTYKLYLQTIQSNASFLSGSASTILGGLGAIFTDSGVSRALAGAAGISAGVGAQFQESYFMSLAVPAISEGIDNARQTIFNQIAQQRKSDIHLYTLQNALLDAVRYDGACSIPRGLQEVADAARNVRTPGAFVMQRAIEQFAAARSSLNDLARIEASPGESSAVLIGTYGTGSSPDLQTAIATSPIMTIQLQIDAVNAITQSTDSNLSRILATAPTADTAVLKPLVDAARTELANARTRTATTVDATTIRTAAHDIESKMQAAKRALIDARNDNAAKDAASAQLKVLDGEARSKVLLEIEKAAAPFFGAINASRASSAATTKDTTIAYVCRVRDLFVDVYKLAAPPSKPAGCP